MTLADVITRVEASALSSSAKRDLRWAINTFCNGLGLTPIDVPADAGAIREHIGRLSPAMLGIEIGTFDNIKSALRRALGLSGNAARPRARNMPLIEPWARLYGLLVDRKMKAKLGGLISFFSEQGYLPEEIEDAHLARFAQTLEQGSINPKWLEIVKGAAREWKRAAEAIPGWPQVRLTAPGTRAEPFCLPWEELPSSFREDAERYIAYLADPPLDDDFAPAMPLRASSLGRRRFDLRHFASVLLRHGWPQEELNSVTDLLRPAALNIIFKHFEPQPDGAGKSRHWQVAIVLKVINKYRNNEDKEIAARLQREIRRHGKKRRGMVRKNREILALFKDDQVAARLVMLPPRLFAALERIKKPTVREANLALAALYVELALMWPLRVGNMSSIHLRDNVLRSGKGPSARVFLHFEADQVKNDVDLEAELPPTAVRFLDLFCRKYRPLLIHEPSLYLFPAKDGGPRSRQTMWNSIKKVTKRWIGIGIAPHQFRHIDADLYLRARPGEYETVRRFLGHRSIDTTTTSYAGAETAAAIRLHDENILRLREAAPAVLARGRRRRRRPAPRSASATGDAPTQPEQGPTAQRSPTDVNPDEI